MAIIAGSIAVTVAALAVLAYVFVSAQVTNSLDRSLYAARDDLVRQQVDDDSDEDDLTDGLPSLEVRTRPGGPAYFVQLVAADGRTSVPANADASLPATADVRELARDGGDAFIYDSEIDEVHLRVLAAPYGPDTVVLIAAPSLELDDTLGRLQVAAVLTGLTGPVLGAVIGLLATRATIRPLRRLTEAAETVARTRDLSTRLPVRGKDEISRLTATFNDMLQALRAAEASQRRLVSDASHELRTPLTSLRVNVELLAGRGGELPEDERQAVLEDIIAQASDLGQIMTGLFDLARGEERAVASVSFAADLVVAEALAGARRDWPQVTFRADVSPCRLVGDPARFGTAVTNLIDNAATYAGSDGPVDVELRADVLRVRDRGPGIAPEDREHVFERFRRAERTQNVPGSGLGLAIVKQVMSEIGATVQAQPRPGGGTDLVVDLGRPAAAARTRPAATSEVT